MSGLLQALLVIVAVAVFSVRPAAGDELEYERRKMALARAQHAGVQQSENPGDYEPGEGYQPRQGYRPECCHTCHPICGFFEGLGIATPSPLPSPLPPIANCCLVLPPFADNFCSHYHQNGDPQLTFHYPCDLTYPEFPEYPAVPPQVPTPTPLLAQQQNEHRLQTQLARAYARLMALEAKD